MNEKLNEKEVIGFNEPMITSASITATPSEILFSKNANSTSVFVSCADTGWTVSGGESWCNITKISSTEARIGVLANSGDYRTTAVVCINGSSVATIIVHQKGQSYDRTNKVTQPYLHQTQRNCAAVCAAMCVMEDLDYANSITYLNFSTVAESHGYTCTGPTDCLGNFTPIFTGLKSGYPVIVQVNDYDTSHQYEDDHWVVAVKYNGGAINSALSYTCVDPATGSECTLSSATWYTNVYKYVIYSN